MQYSIVRTLVFSLIAIGLTGCVSPDQLAAQKKLQEDTGMCVQMAHDYDSRWKHKKLADISSNFLKGIGDQKTNLYMYDKILSRCEAVLSSEGNAAIYANERASISDLRGRIENTYVGEEKNLFLSRTGGRTLCRGSELHDLFYNPNASANEHCLYSIPPGYIPLQAMQVTQGMILVDAEWMPGRIIAIYNDNAIENGLVDKSAIPPGYFAYVGNFSYESLTGERRVYSFRRIPNPFENILFYNGY